MNPFEDFENFEEYDDFFAWMDDDDDVLDPDTDLYEEYVSPAELELWEDKFDTDNLELWPQHGMEESTRDTHDVSEIVESIYDITEEEFLVATRETRDSITEQKEQEELEI